MSTTEPAASTLYRRLGGPATRVRLRFLRSETVAAKALASALLIAGLVALLEIGSLLSFVIPSPIATAEALGRNVGDASYRETVGVTTRNVAFGFAIGFSIGLALGSVLGLSERARRAIEPSLMAANAMPVIVLYPLMIPLLTIGSPSKVAMGALIAIFPVALMVAGGLHSLPPIYSKLARSLQMPKWRVLLFLVVPAVRRQLVSAMRIGFGVATIGVILAEFFAAHRGLGLLIRRDYELARYPELMASIALLILASFLVAFLLWRVERNLE